MVQATIYITGLGPVEINTDAAAVTLAGALTGRGRPINCKIKKVRRNKKAALAAAAIASKYWACPVAGHTGVFILVGNLNLRG